MKTGPNDASGVVWGIRSFLFLFHVLLLILTIVYMKQYHHQPNPDDDDAAAATSLCRCYITAHPPSLQTRVGGVVDYNRVRDETTTTSQHTPPSLQSRVGGVVFIYFTTNRARDAEASRAFVLIYLLLHTSSIRLETHTCLKP
jgi:hypothetical protein